MGAARACALAICLALGAACAHHKPAPAHDEAGVVHHVRAGETLWRIAHTYGVPLESILHENALEDPTRLAEGTQLFIPGAMRELRVPPLQEAPAARSEVRLPRRLGPSAIPRAGTRPLDEAARRPMLWPAPGVLISGFGARERDHHDGIDLACPEGTPVRAAEEGVVLFAGEQRGYGKLVVLAHDNDLVTIYAHNASNLVEKGEHVRRGAEIARVGQSGNATGPHLHFEVRLGARPRDPLGFLR